MLKFPVNSPSSRLSDSQTNPFQIHMSGNIKIDTIFDILSGLASTCRYCVSVSDILVPAHRTLQRQGIGRIL